MKPIEQLKLNIALPEPDEWFTTADVLAYARLCTQLCGLDDWQWKVKRGRYAGCCYYRSRTPALNPDYLNRSHLEIRATIIHELAHALAPLREGHGPIRKLWGAALGQPGMWVPGYILPSPWAYALLMKPSLPKN